MRPVLLASARSDVGRRRQVNEDAGYAGPDLLVVADGMGGHVAGEVASAVAVAALARLARDRPAGDPQAALREAVVRADAEIARLGADDPSLDGMGTTVTALLSTEGGVVLLHVGDSRAYRLADGALEQLSHDHTLVQALVDAGELTLEQAASDPRRSLLVQAVDGRGAVQPDLVVVAVDAGDRLLVCSDGLTGVVPDDEVARVLTDLDRDAAADELVRLALAAGAPDNVTLVVADVAVGGGAPDGRAHDGTRVGAARDGAPAADPLEATGALPTVGDDDDPDLAGGSPGARRLDGDGVGAPAGAGAEAPDEPASRPRRRRAALVVLGVLVVVAALLAGAAAWASSRWVVGADDGEVVLRRGLVGEVAGVPLSRVDERTGVQVDDLPVETRRRVLEGVAAADRADARELVDDLRERAS